MKWVASLWRKTRKIASLPAKWIEQRKRPKVQLYHYKHVEEFPHSLETHKLYIAGENGFFWAASMLCPCGCGAVIELNLLKKARPCWTPHEHPDGLVSLVPSVWRRQGCRSHFYLRRGRIDWCHGYSSEGREGERHC